MRVVAQLSLALHLDLVLSPGIFLIEREFANIRTTCYLKGVIDLQHMEGDTQLSR